ncbi:MAG: diacylglycerol/lipid kinase family protein [Acidimicrobiia bacterium]
MSWWVVVNPSSGRGRELERRSRSALASAGVDHVVRVSESASHVAELVAEGRREGASNFASVGGDGTAHLVVDAVFAEPWPEPPTIAILPAGSGSDFIRTFGLPRTIEEMAAHLATPDRYRCDVGAIEGSFGLKHVLNVADVGVAAASARVAERLPRRLGALRYGLSFWAALARFPAAPVRLETESRSYEGPALNVVVANGQFFGGGMNIAPRAMLVDGEFDIQVFLGPRRRAFTLMPRVIRGLHLGHPAVRRFSSASFRLSCPESWPVEADGELLGRGPVTGRVLPGAIDFKI